MIKLVNVSKYYSSNDVIALGLRKVNLELHLNEFVAVVGESGSGKTTFLNVISGIDSYEEGEMYINGQETSYFSVEDMENYRKKYVAFVFQSYNLIDAYTVLQNVEAPLILSGYPKEKIKERAMEIIKRVGLEKHSHHKATKLSGGQKQRVVIARALAKDCPIIAADEPTGNLDSASAKGIIELLHEISKDKLVIIVTHDFNQVKEYATRKIRIYDGEVVEDRKLTKVEEKDLPVIADKEYNIKFTEFLKMAFRNLLSVPKKSMLMVIVFAFFSMFVALAFGGYYITLNESTFNYNYHFSNTNPNRIVVKKTDDGIFTQTDLDELSAYNNVQVVLPFDYILDMNVRMQFNNAQYFLRSTDAYYLPVDLISAEDLNYGNMPSTDQDVVLAVNSDDLEDAQGLIGTSFYANNLNYAYDGTSISSNDNLVISGVIEKSKLIISNNSYYQSYIMATTNQLDKIRKDQYLFYALNAYFTGSYNDGTKTISFIDSYKYSTKIIIDSTLGANEMTESVYRSNGACLDSVCTITGDIVLEDSYVDNTINNVSVSYDPAITDQSEVRISAELYDQIFYDDVYQVSVLTNTDVDVKGLFRNIQNIETATGDKKYDAIYPYDSNATDNFSAIALLMTNIGMITLIVVVLLGSTLITYVIFRAIINTKLHDYAIFRTIGANRKVIRYFIYLENIYVVLIAYLIFLAISLSLPNSITIDSGLFYALKVFTLPRYIIFFFLEIIMSLFISYRYCNRIFAETVNRTLKTNLG